MVFGVCPGATLGRFQGSPNGVQRPNVPPTQLREERSQRLQKGEQNRPHHLHQLWDRLLRVAIVQSEGDLTSNSFVIAPNNNNHGDEANNKNNRVQLRTIHKLPECPYICMHIQTYVQIYMHTFTNNCMQRHIIYKHVRCVYISMCMYVRNRTKIFPFASARNIQRSVSPGRANGEPPALASRDSGVGLSSRSELCIACKDELAQLELLMVVYDG